MAEGVDPPDYRPIFEDIRNQITSGTLATGEVLPSIPALMEHYDASISVVRRALVELRTEGLIRSRQGKGSYVQPLPGAPPSSEYRELTQTLGQLQNYLQEIDERVARIERNQAAQHDAANPPPARRQPRTARANRPSPTQTTP